MNDKAVSLTRLIQWIDLKLRRAEVVNRKFGKWRFLAFGLTLLFIPISLFQPASVRPLWYGLILACMGAFIFLVIRHNRLKRDIIRLRLWRKIKETNLARIRLDWDNLPVRNYPVSPRHPYARDLDITGDHSLLQLLNTTISTRGTRFLMDWLLQPETAQAETDQFESGQLETDRLDTDQPKANLNKQNPNKLNPNKPDHPESNPNKPIPNKPNPNKPDLNNLRRRQRLVRELKGLSLFRDKLALEALSVSALSAPGAADISTGPLSGTDMIGGEINGEKIMARLQHPISVWIPRVLKWEIGLWLATALFFGGWLWFHMPPLLWCISYLAYSFIFLLFLPSLAPTFHRCLSLQMEFRKLQAIFLHLEKKISGKASPELARCCAAFKDAENRPSTYLKRVSRVCDALSIQGNSLVHLGVNTLCPWDFFFVCRWEKLRRQMLKEIPLWLDALGEVEAASALANMAANNPDYTLPSLETGQEASEVGMAAANLGHPCLPAETRKTNDFALKGLGTLALVTGSNMAGKSTFLRTVGVNFCLAQAGGFVCASSFHSSWFRIYGCIKVTDSVTEGLSYFYAEVKRLKGILDAARDLDAPPLLALIDEIFKGTNNRERITGSTHYLRELIKNNMLGLVSTHDLEVTRIQVGRTRVGRTQEKEKGAQTPNEAQATKGTQTTKEAQTPNIVNFHFQETIEDGQMKFDYRLRPGICPTTNALKIMQLEGLPVAGIEDD